MHSSNNIALAILVILLMNASMSEQRSIGFQRILQGGRRFIRFIATENDYVQTNKDGPMEANYTTAGKPQDLRRSPRSRSRT